MGIRNSKTENMLITMAFETDCHVGPLGLLAMTGFFDSLTGPVHPVPKFFVFFEKTSLQTRHDMLLS